MKVDDLSRANRLAVELQTLRCLAKFPIKSVKIELDYGDDVKFHVLNQILGDDDFDKECVFESFTNIEPFPGNEFFRKICDIILRSQDADEARIREELMKLGVEVTED
jgi:hypothetical protein